MTTKQIAEATGKAEKTVRTWASKLAASSPVIAAKIAASSSTHPADYTLEETCSIIEFGMGKNASDLFRMSAKKPTQNAEVTLVTQNESNVTQEAFKIMAMAFDRLTRITESQESRLSKIETKIEQRQALLPAPQIKPRDHITKIVRENAHKSGVEYSVVWGCLYKEFGYRTNSNPRLAAKNRGMTIIDYIEAEGQIETLEAIAIEHLT